LGSSPLLSKPPSAKPSGVTPFRSAALFRFAVLAVTIDARIALE
jgi:hypothetical protein